MAIMEVAHGKNHPYVTELRQEMSSGKLKKWATLDGKPDRRHFLLSLNWERSRVYWRERERKCVCIVFTRAFWMQILKVCYRHFCSGTAFYVYVDCVKKKEKRKRRQCAEWFWIILSIKTIFFFRNCGIVCLMSKTQNFPGEADF